MKKTLSVLLALVLTLCMALPVVAEETAALEGGIAEIQKYGNLVVSGMTGSDLAAAGYEHGDVLNVTVDGVTNQIPLCTDYSDVDVGELVLRDKDDTLIIAINMGDFTSTYGLAVKHTAEDRTVTWEVANGRTVEDMKVAISMGEKGAYATQLMIHQLERTNERADYASDEVFANFRGVVSGDLGEGALFRSSSPVNNELGRAAFADAFVGTNGINTVVNLTDFAENVPNYFAAEGFNSPNYKALFEGGHVAALNLSVDFRSDDFKTGLAVGLRFMAENKGPYLVHCTEGKDRAGFTSALLACLMGATYDEVTADYMTTYENYYHIEKGDVKYEAVKESNINGMLRYITGVEDVAALTPAELTKAAEEYILSAGLTADEIATLKANLAEDYAAEVPAA